MPAVLSTANVPDSEFLLERRIETAVPTGYRIDIGLNPFKYRRKLWFASGVLNTPGSLKVNGHLEFSFKGAQVFQLPYHVNIGDGVFFGANAQFGTAAALWHFDEALFADLTGKYIGSTPFRCIVTADKVSFVNEVGFSMAGGDTWFAFLACQQEFPY